MDFANKANSNKYQGYSNSLGYSLLEVMITIAIIALLASIAIPQYDNKFKKARFVEVILAVEAIKKGVETCFITRGGYQLENCNTLIKLGISPESINTPTHVKSVQLSFDKTIKITGVANPSASNGDNDNYILEGSESNNTIIWSLNSSSTCIAEGTC
ncbi:MULTISPECIES: prepilin-type N-terminal cleavage/methylation domain-containing protein [unclassified Pseudoalteromonas]|uniref:pilin n=1 Tax=unclassified Pseudoalteromonas TaxID=194690 RepID=UPI001EF4B54F|nr:prepilin-type N-terminal cleavage/methylation domain-containing protein [Pseudoalteromonas sp. Of11M-6]MCG7555532.1 prepilin-type N-terminal cleavage/methylation domain-containing protein [Pseudoalteromonas sp. Of11M-6]